MKKIFTFIPVLCFLFLMNACKKDNPATVDKNYFVIENATYISSGFPKASSGNIPVISSISGNASILEGGSNPISITTSSSIKEILIGVNGKSGYYKVDVNSLKSTMNTYLIYLLFSQYFESDNFTIIIAIVDNNNLISNSEYVNVSKIVAGTGKLQVSCSWNQLNDVDLHLVEPNGTEIYWDKDTSKNKGILDVDSNPTCYIDYINNENITYSENAIVESGKYIVRIALFKSCNVTDLTNYAVTVRYNGQLITPTLGKNPYYGSVEPSQAYIDGDGPREGVKVMEFTIPSTKSVAITSTEKKKMLKFSFPNRNHRIKELMDAERQ